jgi:hypothetical protein
MMWVMLVWDRWDYIWEPLEAMKATTAARVFSSEGVALEVAEALARSTGPLDEDVCDSHCFVGTRFLVRVLPATDSTAWGAEALISGKNWR